MADLNEVLRSFALQKMQELKEEERDNRDTGEAIPASDKCIERQHSLEVASNSNGKDEHKSANSELGDGNSQKVDTSSEQPKSEIGEKTKNESKPVQTETSCSRDGKDKKITIKLLTKKIEPEAAMQTGAMEEVVEDEIEDEDSSVDSSDDEIEGESKAGKPWRKVYEDGELSPSSRSEEEEDGQDEANVTRSDGVDSDTSGEIKDEDARKSKKHKKRKHKKHKHSKDRAKELPPRDKHKDRTKKDKKRDKEKKDRRSKDKERDPDKERSKDKKRSKDKASKDSEVDKVKEEIDSGKGKRKDKGDKKEAKEKKRKSKHKERGGDSKDEKAKSSSKRKRRSGSRSRSPSPDRSKSTSHEHKKRRRSRSRSRSPTSRRRGQSARSRSRERAHYRSTSPGRFYSSRYGSGSRCTQRSRSGSRSRSRSPRPRLPRSNDEFKIDKAKLLEIAKANAYAKMQSGVFPPYMKLTQKSVVTKVDPKERRSVEELTAVCKEISSKQQDSSDSDASPVNIPVGSDDETDEPFIRHPFKVREAPLGNVGIVMNIRNAVQKPIQDKEMLRLTFPVSSGSQHRKKEDELGPKPYGDWVSVEKKPNMMDPVAKPTTKVMATPGTATLTPTAAAAPGATSVTAAAIAPTATDPAAAAAAAAMPPPPVPPITAAAGAAAAMPAPPLAPPPATTAPAPPLAPPPAPLTFAGLISPAGSLPTSSAIAAASAVPAAVAAAEYASAAAAAAVSKAVSKAVAETTPPAPIGVEAVPPVATPEEAKDDKVFEDIPTQKVDIAAMVSARLKAARRLENNPNDVEALSVMHKAQTQIRNWTIGKHKPGMFTGDTGLRTLRPQELANTDPRAQAWAKKNMFHNQAPITGGNKGAMLMAKMGWRQGEGLGKNNEGVLEPLALDVKTDRKGLVAEDEQKRKKAIAPKTVFKDLSGKHPVSALMEICNKRKWAPPVFDLVQDLGPAHKKNFVFKVRINNEEYQPSVSCPNKKQAKAQAAAAALQKMGLVPPDQCM